MTPILIIIPARLESTRLPRKLLLAETGRPLLWHTYQQCLGVQAEYILAVVDCQEFADAMKPFGCTVCVSCRSHPNGTSRVAEAFDEFVADYLDGDNAIVVNVQADEPEIDPALIDKVVAELQAHPEWDCATAATYPFEGVSNPNRVKVACNIEQVIHDSVVVSYPLVAADFTRETHWQAFIHIGIYAYRAAALRKYAAAGPCSREVAESLEQLRALHIGLKMGVVLWDGLHHAGIDTRADYDAFVDRYKRLQEVDNA